MNRIDAGANHVRYALGDLVVIALRDGHVDMPPSRLRQAGGRPLDADLPAQVALVEGKLRLSVNAFLIVDRDRHVLIDTGAANAWLPTMGHLLRALEEAGVSPGDIGTVALTHTHEDHVNGLVAADGSDAFANLERLFVPQKELAMFDGQERLARFHAVRRPLTDGFKVTPNITAVAAHGHEVGHTAFEVASGGETLVIWGDVVHVPSIQFARPDLTWELDADQDQARESRRRMFHRAARPNVFVAGAHHEFPGIGAVFESDGAYRYTPH